MIPWNPESWFFSYAIPNPELLPKACLAASPTPTPQKKRRKEIFSISGGKLENEKGADISTEKKYSLNDDVPLGYVISNDRQVEVGGTLHVDISRGKNVLLRNDDKSNWDNLYDYDEYQIGELLDYNELTYNIINKTDSDKPSGHLHSISRSDGGDLKKGVYCPQDVTVTVEISSKIS